MVTDKEFKRDETLAGGVAAGYYSLRAEKRQKRQSPERKDWERIIKELRDLTGFEPPTSSDTPPE